MLESQFVTIIIEDDPGHLKLIEKNLRRGGLESHPIKAFENGQQALEFLRKSGNFEDNPINRCVLLLDINMPVMNGVELLRILKHDNRLRDIPVIVLTSTDDQREIDECYSLGCNLYVPKPVEFNQFSEVVRELGLMIGLIAVPSFK